MKKKISSLIFLFLFWAGTSSAQFLDLISPNGGETWAIGSGQFISWTGIITPGASVDIFMSYDGGQFYTPLATGVPDAGFYQVTQVTGPASSQCVIKIMESGNPAIFDSSDAVFSIVPGQPLLSLIYPAGGEFFPIGGTRNVLWSSQNIDTIKVELSINGGTNWSLLQADIPAANGFAPVVFPGPASSTCRLRISDQNNPAVSDVSPANFEIRAPFIFILAPVVNQVLLWGDDFNVSWNSALLSDFVNIEVSYNNGLTFDTIALNQPNLGSYLWTVPSGVTSSNCVIAVRESSNPTVAGLKGPFRIQAPVPTIDILYPNGGESFVGSNLLNVQFSSQHVTTGVIEFSLDSMQTWQNLGTFVQGETSLPWFLPGNVNSDDCFIRGYDLSGGNGDTSNAAFTISIPVPAVFINTPFGGETWAVGSTQQISWISSYIGQLKIEYSTNGGTTWSVIEPAWNAAASPYSWTVTGPASANAFIRLSDVTNPSTSASNTTPFNIVAPYLQITSPNGGEIIAAGLQYNIQWQGSTTSGLVNIDYSVDNGLSWTNIISSYATQGGFVWLVPNSPSNNCKIRIAETGNPGVTDQSDAVFTIAPAIPEIILTAPVQTDIWSVGNGGLIQWVSSNINTADIFLSTDSGVTFTQIASGVSASQGFYVWTVISDTTSNAFVVVKDAQSAAADTSERFKIISLISGIQLLNPVGGEIFAAGSVQTISWLQGGVQPVNVEYSYNNGQNWISIASNLPFTTNSISWVVPSFISSQYMIRVYDVGNPSVVGVCPVFSVVPAFLTMVSPNGGENIGGLSPFIISWQGQGIAASVALEYSVNNGLTWNTIISNVPASGTFTWLTPPVQSSQCKVRVKTISGTFISDVSNAAFTINMPSPLVKILSPNGGENFGSGQTVNIQFITFMVNYVKLEYSVNGGINWGNIVNVFPAQNGIYAWTIPQWINSSNVLVRISNAANTTMADVSDAPFTVGAPNVTLLSPNGGELLNPGATTTITWTGTGLSAFMKLEWSSDSMQTWQIIQPSVQNTGSYVFPIPNQPSPDVFFRITDALNTGITDVSNGPAVISGTPPAPQNIISPNGGEEWVSGQNYLVNWSFPQSSAVKIELSTNGGASWTTLLASVNAALGNAQITLPQITSAQCLLKISDVSNPTVNDVSNAPFSIGSRYLDLGATAVSYAVGSPMPVSWSSYSVDFVDLFLSSDGGSNWSVIDTNIYNQHSYVLQLPSVPGNNYRIRVIATDFPSVRDSSVSFGISNSNSLSWLSPSQDVALAPGNTLLLQWQGSGYPFAKMEFSSNGGTSWQTLSDSLSMTQGIFSWTIQGTPTTNGKFRITGFGNGTPQSVIAPFTLSILSGAPSVTLVYPNGGEQLESGSYVQVSWTHNNAALLDLFISTNGGATYSQVSLVPTAPGSYLWQVPNTTGNSVRLRLSVNGISVIQDASDANFSIVPATASGQVISIDSVSSFSVCRGDSLYIPFSVNGLVSAGASFQVLISDASSNPSQFQLLRTFNYSGSATDSVLTSIPSTLSPGFYNVFIACQSPALLSSAAPQLLEVKGFNVEVLASSTSATLPGLPVTFSTIPSGSTYDYTWDFGFSNSTAASPQVSYNSTGIFGLSLTMVSSEGCVTSVDLPNFISVNYLFMNQAVPGQADSSDFMSLSYYSQSGTWTAVSSVGDVAISDNGEDWVNADLPATAYLSNRTSALRGQELYAAGLNGYTFRSLNGGLTWTPLSLQTAEAVNDIHFGSVTTGIACGTNGMVRRYNGNIWQATNALTSAELFACHTGNGYQLVAGAAGTIRRGVLSIWDTIASPIMVTWYDILMRDSLNGYICGANGSIAKTVNAGMSWQLVMTGYPAALRKLWFSGDTIWAVGEQGIIMESADAGNSWVRKSNGFPNEIRSIAYDRRTRKGFMVGTDGLFRKFGSEIYVPPPPPSAMLQQEPDQAFVMFPNPASDIIMFRGLDAENIYNISIYSSDGRLITTSSIRGENLMQGISTGILSRGLYLVNISTSGWEGSQRLIITR